MYALWKLPAVERTSIKCSALLALDPMAKEHMMYIRVIQVCGSHKSAGHISLRVTKSAGHISLRVTKSAGHISLRVTKSAGHISLRVTKSAGHISLRVI